MLPGLVFRPERGVDSEGLESCAVLGPDNFNYREPGRCLAVAAYQRAESLSNVSHPAPQIPPVRQRAKRLPEPIPMSHRGGGRARLFAIGQGAEPPAL